MTDKQRVAFETFMAVHFAEPDLKRSDSSGYNYNGYASPHTGNYYSCWQAAQKDMAERTDKLVLELGNRRNELYKIIGESWAEHHANGLDEAIDKIKQLIDS